jgi:serine protease Do
MKMKAKCFRFVKRSVLFNAVAVAVLAGIAVATAAATKPPKVVVSDHPIDRSASLPASFAPVVKRVAPSVVNIFSTRKVSVQRYSHPFLDDELFRRFFGDEGTSGDDASRPRMRKSESLGSGVIISDDGYILTNNHVVEGADEIKVALADDKTEYTAKVIGTDPQTDLAILKVDAKKLTTIIFADSDKIEVGDIVLAIGNPFGVGQTVTKGIISAMGRGGFGIIDYEDFIQTDAPINQGNSGGALVDIEGRLVGINQSIVSPNGGSQGIGFAIPANLARSIMERIVTDGTVKRGYLGVNIQPVTAGLAREFDLRDQQGALVGGVQPGTPAGDAGFKEGDVILEFNGKPVSDPRHLRLMVSQTPPKTKVTLKTIRDGKEKVLTATLGALPEELAAGPAPDRDEIEKPSANALDGVDIADLDGRVRRRFGVPTEIQGALVTGVETDSPAQEAGLRAGDIIVGIDRKPVKGAEEASQLLRKAKGDGVLLRVWNRAGGIGSTRYLVIEPAASK